MTEERLREILAKWLGIAPDEITDETCIGNPPSFDSLCVMNLVMSSEPEIDRILSDDEVASLTSWPNVKSIILGTETAPTFYKALVLDADGTLWQGVLGEGGIDMTPEFEQAQTIYRGLQERGVLLAVASKNEQHDLEEVFGIQMPLTGRDFAIIHGGWGNKVLSLKDIAKTLNIGLDALVFVDDSPFECAYVRAQLPMVKVVQVPKNIADYPRVAQEIADLFPVMIDKAKTEQYHAIAEAEKTRPQFASDEEFLASLQMTLELHCNRPDEVARISELTMKANQFNLTTRRYDEAQIADWMNRGYVYSVNVKDKFGDQGLVGVVIVDYGRIDTFLLSCRILGRGIEKALWGPIVQTMREIGWHWMVGQFVPTAKNEQVRDFWKSLGFEPRIGGDWVHPIDTLAVPCPSWIEVTSA